MNFIEGTIDLERGTFVRDGLVVKLTEQQTHKLKSHGSDVLLGIRPEHVSICEAENGIQASVYVTELMGNETLVFLSVGSQRLIARAPAEFRPGVESIVWLTFAIEKAHFFDTRTEQRL